MEQQELIQKQETEYLQHTLAVAEKELAGVLDNLKSMEEEMEEEKKEARENITYGIQDMSSPDDFEAFVELSQSMSHIDKMVSDYDEYKARAKMLRNLMKSPYFARIDFLFDDGFTDSVYIGRRSLSDKITRDPVVYDWRTPIAGVFYRFLPGPAYYDAPAGRIDGELLLKRQFEIKEGKLSYFFDADRTIQDEILRQLLSQNTSPKMKAIVETIQQDQDVVIRDMDNDLLMVQGVAGSGKTSIALHRAAFLMYQGTQAGLKADNIVILSPNSTFEDYIAGVLPELGEDNIASVTFEDLLKTVVKDRSFESHRDFLELSMTDTRESRRRRKSMTLKTSTHFLELLRFYMDTIPEFGIEYRNIYYKGRLLISAKQLQEQLLKRPYTPLHTRLKQLQEFVLELAFGTGSRKGHGDEVMNLTLQLQEFLTLDPILLYKNFFASEAYYEELLTECDSSAQLDKIIADTLETLEFGPLHYEDAIAIAYLDLKLREKGLQRQIRQVVIDEAQDYYPMQFEILGLLYPAAKFTVLGDINQTLAKQETMDFYHGVQKALRKEKTSLITLNKSFRCTGEILQYSLQYLDQHPKIESFNREGAFPQVLEAANEQELANLLLREIETCEQAGYGSICLLTKSGKQASAIHAMLQKYYPEDLKKKLPRLILDYTGEDLTGSMLMPIYLSKGLEFDAVLLADFSEANYHTSDDRKLLYVACTRALHRLDLFRQK